MIDEIKYLEEGLHKPLYEYVSDLTDMGYNYEYDIVNETIKVYRMDGKLLVIDDDLQAIYREYALGVQDVINAHTTLIGLYVFVHTCLQDKC